VTDFSPTLATLAADLRETMHHHEAMGIAAPQAGTPLRLAIVGRGEGGSLVLVNPKITRRGGSTKEGFEACLSLPGIRCLVGRPDTLRVTYQTLSGACEIREDEGMPARIVAHEVDHLDGILCTDRATRVLVGAPP
jgi:peptide deformylase